MLTKLLILLLALVIVGPDVLAQEERRAFPYERQHIPIDSAEVVLDNERPVLKLIGTVGDLCDLPLEVRQDRSGSVWFIDFTRDVPRAGTVCPFGNIPVEQLIDAQILTELNDKYMPIEHVIINGMIFNVERSGIAPDGSDVTLSIPTLSNAGGIKVDLDVQRVSVYREAQTEITLYGTYGPCVTPAARAVEDYQNPGFVTVEAFGILSIAATCERTDPADFEYTMVSPSFESLAVKGISIPFKPELSVAEQAFSIQPMFVATVEATRLENDAVEITITGTTDGCTAPIQMVPQPPVDNTVRIEVVRVMPLETMCTMIAVEYTQTLRFTPAVADPSQPILFFIGAGFYELP